MITFDDVPVPKSRLMQKSSAKGNLTSTLDQLKGVQAAFFILGRYVITDEEKLLLDEINDSQQFIGNHSESHLALSAISVNQFKDDFFMADELLSQYSMYRKWFRFPYLDFGKGDRDKLNQVFEFLKLQNYMVAYSTINPPDFSFDAKYKNAVDNGAVIDYNILKQSYLQIIEESIDEAERIMQRLNLNLVQVLDIHQNDLNSLFLGDIIDLIQNKKHMNIVLPEKAFVVSFSNFEDYKKMQEPFFIAWKLFPEKRLEELFRKAVLKPANQHTPTLPEREADKYMGANSALSNP